MALLRIIAYHPTVAMRAMIRVRRARNEKPEPKCLPPRLPRERTFPRVIGDDLEP